ncbi:hypothetical protein COCON_G00220110 [Conger conger]|uniref:Uncharacterized protein n=1 Tax=Conger conger TaxID=82655 RepID=A0A9Q1CZB9_CONCO|nr:hypothetical protein COCON_G00220110 [Conger conger]
MHEEEEWIPIQTGASKKPGPNSLKSHSGNWMSHPTRAAAEEDVSDSTRPTTDGGTSSVDGDRSSGQATNGHVILYCKFGKAPGSQHFFRSGWWRGLQSRTDYKGEGAAGRVTWIQPPAPTHLPQTGTPVPVLLEPSLTGPVPAVCVRFSDQF